MSTIIDVVDWLFCFSQFYRGNGDYQFYKSMLSIDKVESMKFAVRCDNFYKWSTIIDIVEIEILFLSSKKKKDFTDI